VQPESPGSLTDVSPRCTPDDLRPLLTQAVQDAAQGNGWALLAAVGHAALKRCPSFSVKHHGCSRLGRLVSQQDYLEVQPPGAGGDMLVRIRPAAASLLNS
jgi:hypothetical protein